MIPFPRHGSQRPQLLGQSIPRSLSPTPILLERELLERVYQEARVRYPAECCGWMTGPALENRATQLRRCRNAQAGGTHPTQPHRGADSAYVIQGNDLLEFCRGLDSDTPAKLIYHSHSDGRAYFSETDHNVAVSPDGDGPVYPVQQLVIGINAIEIVEAALFAWVHTEPKGGRFVEIQRFAGAQL